ncbi:putative ATP synthase subunit b [Candidatus Xenohaliotis californiensis]|uniref:ATP synthase subunit b n=1 Tax=Candidatus Xenohaliotis californiensis TaxID=84677 RepID=A0ABM9N6V4_9RICK|nr:putative ATP synthase subunit b [Candidatus Xenohaliotis californiensis]
MNNSIPQLNYKSFPSQLLWLFITYFAFYLLLDKVIIPRIRSIKNLRNLLAKNLAKQMQDLHKKEKNITSGYTQKLENANNQVYELINNVRNNINKTIETTCTEFVEVLNLQMQSLKKRLAQTKEEKKLEYKNDVYDLSINIFNSIVSQKIKKK